MKVLDVRMKILHPWSCVFFYRSYVSCVRGRASDEGKGKGKGKGKLAVAKEDLGWWQADPWKTCYVCDTATKANKNWFWLHFEGIDMSKGHSTVKTF